MRYCRVLVIRVCVCGLWRQTRVMLSGEYCVGCFIFIADWMFAYMVVDEVFY